MHLIAIDGHLDAVEPSAATCVGAAAMGLWLLTTPSPFYVGPYLPQANVTTVGAADLQGLEPKTNVVLTSEVNALGAQTIIESFLASVPENAKILIHFDVDVICAAEMPAAYSPNGAGLGADVAVELLSALLSDRRTAALSPSTASRTIRTEQRPPRSSTCSHVPSADRQGKLTQPSVACEQRCVQ